MSWCNADYCHPCDANDGEPCESCELSFQEESAYWAKYWRTASPEERDPEGYRRDMIDAGRGHLIKESEAPQAPEKSLP